MVGFVEGKLDQSFTYLICEAREGQMERHINVRKWEKVRKIDTKVVKITGPKWWSVDNLHDDPIEVEDTQKQTITPTVAFVPEVAATEIDSTMNDAESKRKLEENTSSLAKRMKGGGKGKARKLAGGQAGPSGSSLIDLGGSGDCGWRALSYMLSLGQH